MEASGPMSTTKVGGSFGAHAKIALAERATLECEVHGITDEDAARVLLDDTQVGVARRVSDRATITVKVPASFLGDTLSPVNLRVEVGRSRLVHGRSGAEQALEWTAVATITVQPERAFVVSFVAASAPMALSGWVLVDVLSGPSQSSHARLMVDAATVAVACVPMVAAVAAKAAGASKWPRVRALSVLATALVLGSSLSSVAVDNRTGAALTLSGGARLATGVSRWLPFEPAARRSELESRAEVLTDRDERACVSPLGARPLSSRLWPGLRVIARGGMSVSRSALQRMGIVEGDLCDRATSEGEQCCVRPERAESVLPMRSEPGTALRGEWRLHMSSAGDPLTGAGFGTHLVGIRAWHGLALSGAQRTVGRVEARWSSAQPQRALTLNGFSADAPREVSLSIADGPSLSASCPSTTDTIHAIRAIHRSLRSITVDGNRVDLRVNQPSFLCATNAPQRVSISLEPTPAGATEPPWAAMGHWALPTPRATVDVYERTGGRELHLGTAHCPVEHTRNLSVVPVQLAGLGQVARIEQHPAGGRSSPRWTAGTNAPSQWAFLCVPSAPGDAPASAPTVDSRAMDFRVHTVGDGPTLHGRLFTGERWTIRHDPSPLAELARCCFDPATNILITCPEIHRYQRFVQRGDSVPADCGSVWRVEWVRRPTRVEVGPDGRLTPWW
jgi:hypothetical protein